LTTPQVKALLSATKANDFMIVAHKRTMDCLVGKGLAEWSSGLGYPFGAIIELTCQGREIRKNLIAGR
jgi:hypothetical protein